MPGNERIDRYGKRSRALMMRGAALAALAFASPIPGGLTAAMAQAQAPAAPANRQLMPKDATPETIAANNVWLADLPFADRSDFENAKRGFIGSRSEPIKIGDRMVWNFQAYDFEKPDQAPPTVNPSLWRQAQLNNTPGLYQVTDRIYQVRGFDLSNMNVIEGDTGLIIMDPLISVETARAALELYFDHRPRKPVVAVIYTHSHIDHFGGARGVVDEADVKSGKVRIIAPEHFLEEAVSENVLAGNAMSRRAQFMYGMILPKGPKGQVDAGIGKQVSQGTISLIAPTESVSEPFSKKTVDGVEIEFQLTPHTEAPAEMNLYFPQFKALCIAENAVRTQHNVLTLRGAQVRDPKIWSFYLSQALDRYGERSEVMFAQHTWPTWGGAAIREFLADQRDMYAFLNNETLRLINLGFGPLDIADRVKRLPDPLAKKWYARDYYGSVSHNVRAVYQRYMGFYDGNPANLNPLPPVASAKLTVEWMGGAANVISKAQESFAKGDYRWVAQIMNQVVFAEPDNRAARELGADAMEQLGYQSENSTWRNIYLAGARELRNGITQIPGGGSTASPDIVRALPPASFFDLLSVRLNPDKAKGHDMTLNWRFSDTGATFAVTLRNGVLTYVEGRQHAAPTATVTMAKTTLDRITLRQIAIPQALADGLVSIDGQPMAVGALFSFLDQFEPNFALVTPPGTK